MLRALARPLCPHPLRLRCLCRLWHLRGWHPSTPPQPTPFHLRGWSRLPVFQTCPRSPVPPSRGPSLKRLRLRPHLRGWWSLSFPRRASRARTRARRAPMQLPTSRRPPLQVAPPSRGRVPSLSRALRRRPALFRACLLPPRPARRRCHPASIFPPVANGVHQPQTPPCRCRTQTCQFPYQPSVTHCRSIWRTA